MPRQLAVAATKTLYEVLKDHSKFHSPELREATLELISRLDKDLDDNEYAHSTGEGSTEEALLSLTDAIIEFEEGIEEKLDVEESETEDEETEEDDVNEEDEDIEEDLKKLES